MSPGPTRGLHWTRRLRFVRVSEATVAAPVSPVVKHMHGSLRPEVFVYPASCLLTTVFLAAFVCRYGLDRRGRVCYWGLTVSPLLANGAVFFLFGIFWMGIRFFSLEAWQD